MSTVPVTVSFDEFSVTEPVRSLSSVTAAGSSTAVIVRSMSWVVVPPASSVMVTVKASMPLKLAVGV